MSVCGRARQNLRGRVGGVRAAGFSLSDGVIPPEEPEQTLVQSWENSGAALRPAKFRLTPPVYLSPAQIPAASKRCSPSTSAATAAAGRCLRVWPACVYLHMCTRSLNEDILD